MKERFCNVGMDINRLWKIIDLERKQNKKNQKQMIYNRFNALWVEMKRKMIVEQYFQLKEEVFRDDL